MDSSPTSRIIIVGGGLGGLALAQSLQNASPPIRFHVFERDASAAYHTQGYPIRISRDGAAALQKLLPGHLWQAFEATSAQIQPGFSWVGAKTGQPAEWITPPPGPPLKTGAGRPRGFRKPKGKAYNVDRAVLRNILLEGLEEHISFGKKFQRYTTNPEGEVEVTFDDGTKEVGSLLVGADGTLSAIRRQLLPDFTVLDTEGRAVFGKTFRTPDLTSAIPAEILVGMSLTGESSENPVKLMCDNMVFDKALDPDMKTKYHVPSDYVYWALVFRDDVASIEPDELLRFDHAQSAQHAQTMASPWHSSIRALFEQQDVQSASTLAFHTTFAELFVSTWLGFINSADGTHPMVTLLGDAAHPMVPLGGLGANSAFQDAADLFRALVELSSDSQQIQDKIARLKEYERTMVERSVDMVQRSTYGSRPVAELKPVTH